MDSNRQQKDPGFERTLRELVRLSAAYLEDLSTFLPRFEQTFYRACNELQVPPQLLTAPKTTAERINLIADWYWDQPCIVTDSNWLSPSYPHPDASYIPPRSSANFLSTPSEALKLRSTLPDKSRIRFLKGIGPDPSNLTYEFVSDLLECPLYVHPESSLKKGTLITSDEVLSPLLEVDNEDEQIAMTQKVYLGKAFGIAPLEHFSDAVPKRARMEHNFRLARAWSGMDLTWSGMLFLIHLVSIRKFPNESSSSRDMSKRRNDSPEGTSTNFALFVLLMFLYFIIEALCLMGSSRHPCGENVVKFPLSDKFVLGLIGPQSAPNYLDRCSLMAFIEGILGPAQYSSPFHGPKDKSQYFKKKNQICATGLSSKVFPSNPYDYTLVPTGDTQSYFVEMKAQWPRAFLLERRGIIRLFSFFNLTGFFMALPSLNTIRKNIFGQRDYPDSFTAVLKAEGARTQCLASTLADFPVVLRRIIDSNTGKSLCRQYTLARLLGTGSEKSIFAIEQRTHSSSSNDTCDPLAYAIRANTKDIEGILTEVCGSASGQGDLIYLSRDNHLVMPVMRDAEDFLQEHNSVEVLLQYLSLCCDQLIALNKAGYIHRDVKLGNILAALSTEVPRDKPPYWFLLSDFGHASKLGTIVTCSSRSLADPCHLNCPATTKMDIWCLALTTLKFLLHRAQEIEITELEGRGESNSNSVRSNRVNSAVSRDVLYHISKWYTKYLAEKEAFKRFKTRPRGNLDNPNYPIKLKRWQNDWDQTIWRRLIPSTMGNGKGTSVGEGYAAIRALLDFMPLRATQGLHVASQPLPSTPINGHNRTFILDLLAPELLFALRSCMSLDLERRWDAKDLKSWADDWLENIRTTNPDDIIQTFNGSWERHADDYSTES